MILLIYSIKDRAAQAFGRPMFFQSPGVAMRSFVDEVNRSETPTDPNQMNIHPDDFEMYELGEYDDSDGSIVVHKAPKLMAQAKQVIKTSSSGVKKKVA